MTHAREPFVFSAPLDALRPTQPVVGMAEVEAKVAELAAMKPKERAELTERAVVPVVVGPGGAPHPVDHHHESLAMLRAGASGVLCHALADLSRLGHREFWSEMAACGWCYLFDADGRPVKPKALPERLADLADDPYRSLAGFLRKAGGYAKSDAPFAEFRWANHLRSRVPDPTDVRAALRIAASQDASHLPGWVSGR